MSSIIMYFEISFMSVWKYSKPDFEDSSIQHVSQRGGAGAQHTYPIHSNWGAIPPPYGIYLPCRHEHSMAYPYTHVHNPFINQSLDYMNVSWQHSGTPSVPVSPTHKQITTNLQSCPQHPLTTFLLSSLVYEKILHQS